MLNAATLPAICTHARSVENLLPPRHEPGRAKGGEWLYCSHEPAVLADVAGTLPNQKPGDVARAPPGRSASQHAVCRLSGPGCPKTLNPGQVLRFEPLIITLDCRTVDAALALARPHPLHPARRRQPPPPAAPPPPHSSRWVPRSLPDCGSRAYAPRRSGRW